MTSNKKQKKQIRARMDRTGESYSTARQAILAQSQAPTSRAEAHPRGTEEQDEDNWYRQTIADLNVVAAKHSTEQRAEWVNLDTIVKIGGFQESCRMQRNQAAGAAGFSSRMDEGECAGFKRTVGWRSQRRVWRVQRSGWRALAAA